MPRALPNTWVTPLVNPMITPMNRDICRPCPFQYMVELKRIYHRSKFVVHFREIGGTNTSTPKIEPKYITFSNSPVQ